MYAHYTYTSVHMYIRTLHTHIHVFSVVEYGKMCRYQCCGIWQQILHCYNMSGQALNKFIAQYNDSVTFHWWLSCSVGTLQTDTSIMAMCTYGGFELSQLSYFGNSVSKSIHQEHRVSLIFKSHMRYVGMHWCEYCVVLFVFRICTHEKHCHGGARQACDPWTVTISSF